MNEQQIQLLAASTLLEKGVFVDKVKAPLLLRLVGRRWLEVTIYQPTLAELIQISRIVVSMGLDDEKIKQATISDNYHICNITAHRAMEVLLIASRIKVPFWSTDRLVAHLLKNVDVSRFEKAWSYFVVYSSITDFINTIKSIGQLNQLSPMNRRSQHEAHQA